MTAKRIVWGGLALIVIVWAVYLGSTKYDAGRSGAGEIYSNDPPSGRDRTTATDRDSRSNASQTIVYPAAGQTVVTSPSATEPTSSGSASPEQTGQTVQPGTTARAAAGSIPATDSINPEPPNGMVFSGTGQFQLYRQGDITWRLDTKTGRTCIIFATDEEWKKPRVLKAGCGRS